MNLATSAMTTGAVMKVATVVVTTVVTVAGVVEVAVEAAEVTVTEMAMVTAEVVTSHVIETRDKIILTATVFSLVVTMEAVINTVTVSVAPLVVLILNLKNFILATILSLMTFIKKSQIPV